MLNFLQARLGTKLLPIAITIILVLLGSCGVMSKLYLGKVGENTLLSQKLAANATAYEALKLKLDSERAAAESVRTAYSNIELKYKRLSEDAKNIPTTDSAPGLDPVSVAELLCSRGLAEPSACAAANAP